MFWKNRIPKSLNDKLKALDQNLYLLRENLKELKTNESHLKIIAAGLRTLICNSSGTEGLLWRMVDELNINDSIFLHVAGKVDHDHPLSKGLTFSLVEILRGGKGHPKLKPDYYSLKYIIKECESVYINGMSLTHEALIKKIAEQLGIAHEDDGIEPVLLGLKSIFVNGVEPYIPILVIDAEFTIEIGERILEYAEKHKKYKRIIHKENFGNVSFAIQCQVLRKLASRIPIIVFRSFISDVEITLYAGLLGLNYQIKKGSQIIKEIIAYYSDDLEIQNNFVFILSYCSKSQKIRTITNDISQKPEIVSGLGWIFAEDFELEMLKGNKYFINRKNAFAYERLLSTKDSIGILNLKDISELFTPKTTDEDYEFPD